ncbi:NAD-dependent succinate-semialdehyde dehydrogenase [Leptonema illini]|uniref:Aldehyde Dehydrogenase n=1 Tax=Leptonema illini DSM 21528 TaxID=929563 RepID=H2CBR9_9LEPT|nr:NAD-dependent succinate-semialdehyde dehydrogenase [Leptonema illini]EHQ08523.1 Aldehyde Dehydrogenase [Leptonema illini DSM 21528]
MEILTSINPATDETVETFAVHTPADVQRLIDGARRSFAHWKSLPLMRRTDLLRSAAKTLRDGKQKYARIMTIEMGKPITEALAEVDKCALLCDYYAENAERFLQTEIRPSAPFRHSSVRFDPLGIVLAVMPWNFPFWQVFRAAVPALAAGNVMLLKHSSNVSRCALEIEEIFRMAGFPDGVFGTLLLPASRLESVMPEVQAVTLTGSEAAGRSLAALAGRFLKPAVLELGGSDPYIVLADADVRVAAENAVRARCVNSGQSCIAAKRFIVHEKIYDSFLDLFRAGMQALKIGDPLRSETEIGPLARKDLREELHGLVEDAGANGARIVLGGGPLFEKGAYYAPTIIDALQPAMQLYHEEAFGPVAAVLPFSEDEEAVRLANDSRFGLGASIWAGDTERAMAMAPFIEAGSVFINATVRSDPALPFGGIKDSGYGRELSLEGIRSFVNVKTVRLL